MPRFVLLEHDHPVLHWDLMLETGAALRTWRLAAPPRLGTAIAAMALGDHRLAYLDYEGPVSGQRGTVTRWDHGNYEATSLAGALILQLRGARVQGRAELRKLQGDEWVFKLAEQGEAGAEANG